MAIFDSELLLLPRTFHFKARSHCTITGPVVWLAQFEVGFATAAVNETVYKLRLLTRSVALESPTIADSSLPEWRYPFNKARKQRHQGWTPISGGTDDEPIEKRTACRATSTVLLEAMEELIAAIWALFHWRFFLSVIGSTAITVALSKLFVGFTAGYCITFVILATAFGIYWQSRSEAGVGITTQVPEPKISRPVAFLGLSFVGLIWGGLVTHLLKSEFLAVVSLVLSVAVVGLWYRMVLCRPIPPRTIAFSAGALLSGFLSALIAIHLNA